MATAIQFLRSSTPSLRPDPLTLEDGMPMVNLDPSDPGLYFALEDNSLMKVGPTHVAATAPNLSNQGFSGNAKGEMWLDTSSAGSPLRVYDGTSWVAPTVALADDSLELVGAGLKVNKNTTEVGVWLRNGNDTHYDLGKVGIGTSSPTVELDVVGSMKLHSTPLVPTSPSLGNIACVGFNLQFYNGTFWEQLNNEPTLWQEVSGTLRPTDLSDGLKIQGNVSFPNLQTFTGNSNALANGLVAGDLYRLSTGEVMVVF